MNDVERFNEQNEWCKKIFDDYPGRTVKDKKGREFVIKNPKLFLHKVGSEYGEEAATIFNLFILNRYELPKYHIDDANNPRIINIYEAYPKHIYGDLKLFYDSGYVWLLSTKKGKLFMTMHGCSNDLNVINGVLTDLIVKRETPFNL